MLGSGQGLRGTALRGFATVTEGGGAKAHPPLCFWSTRRRRDRQSRRAEGKGVKSLETTVHAPFWHPARCGGWILDWDGVLAATHLSFAPIYERFFDGQRVMLLEVLPSLEPQRREELAAALVALEMEGAEQAEVVPGARELVAWIESRGIPWAVVSRNCRASIDRAAEVMGLPLPPLVFSREEEPVKPHPEALRRAARKMGVDGGRCVVVGDFVYDILGARRAGMRAVLVERGPEPWSAWADVAFPRVMDLVASLGDPEPLHPWEYAALDSQWLRNAWRLEGVLSPGTPLLGAVVEQACALGLGTLGVPPNSTLSPEQWRSWRGLPPEVMGCPLEDVVRRICAERYPLVTVRPAGASSLELPENPEEIYPRLRRALAL